VVDLFDINGVHVPYDKKWKKIGISVSGGADSALLLFLLCYYFDYEIHVTTQIRCWKTRPWQRFNSLEVFNWMQHRFENRKLTRHEGFIPPELEWADKGPNIKDEYGKTKSGNQIILRSHNEYICHSENLNAWFAAVNLNPDIEIDGALEDRNYGHLPPFFEHMKTMICHPFIHTRKDWIMQQYYNYNILDLLNLTRSCEGDKIDYPDVFGDLDYTNYVPGQYVPECGQCFWCKEREWALNRVEA
jgi:hypothetical protein